MVTINLVCVGNLKEKYYKDAVQEYQKRLSRFSKLNIIEVDEYKIQDKPSDKNIELAKEKEGVKILEKCSGYIVLLDLKGKTLSSEDLAVKIEDISQNFSTITFVIGGSFGVSEEVRNKSNYMLSFSKMTLPHQLMRVVLIEQIYRAFTININITYHK